MKKFIVIMILTVLTPAVHGAASSSSSSSNAQNVHRPFVMLIDPNRDETPDNQNIALVISCNNLLTGFIDSAFLVSDSIVYNFLMRNQRKNPEKDSCCFESPAWENWNIYSVPGSQFMLFVPAKDLQSNGRYTQSFQLQSLQKLPSDYSKLSDSSQLIKILEPKIKKPKAPFKPEDLKNIFIPLTDLNTQESIWDIIMHGHGSSSDKLIAGMPITTMQKTLTLLNNHLNMGMLFIETCYAGGINRKLLVRDQQITDRDIPLNLTFPVIIGSIEDTVAFTAISTWNPFFYTASHENIDQVAKTLAVLIPRHSGSPHAAANLPQIWIPGGYGFQTFSSGLNPSGSRVQILSKVMVLAHEDANEPIIIPDTTLNVLVYPEKINVPIYVSQHDTSKDEKLNRPEPVIRQGAWQNFPSMSELLEDIRGRSNPDANDFPTLHKHFNDIKILATGHSESLYPKFTSMTQNEALSQHTFKKIILPDQSGNLPFGGVMQFIRDAFIYSKETQKERAATFIIDTLEGPNDISLLLEMLRSTSRKSFKDELEKFMAQHPDPRIVLQNVEIITGGRAGVWLKFIYGGKAWVTSSDSGFIFHSNNIFYNLHDVQSIAYEEPKQISISEAAGKKLGLKSTSESSGKIKGSDAKATASNLALQARAKMHYLKNKGNMSQMPPELEKHFRGVSVQDLIDTEMITFGYNELYLSKHYINSLKGLQHIPGIKNLRSLYLDNNLLTKIESGAFAGLDNLERLYLSDNRLTKIEAGAFAGLAKLQRLNVSETLPEDVKDRIREEVRLVAPNARVDFFRVYR